MAKTGCSGLGLPWSKVEVWLERRAEPGLGWGGAYCQPTRLQARFPFKGLQQGPQHMDFLNDLERKITNSRSPGAGGLAWICPCLCRQAQLAGARAILAGHGRLASSVGMAVSPLTSKSKHLLETFCRGSGPEEPFQSHLPPPSPSLSLPTAGKLYLSAKDNLQWGFWFGGTCDCSILGMKAVNRLMKAP